LEIGIGLPNAVAGTSGDQLLEWARRAESRGFSTLGTIDRIAYDNYEPLATLAAAGAVTERIGLTTSVLLAPLRTNAVMLAKQALSVHALSGGRLTLGVGLGGRGDDYELSGEDTRGRGERLDDALDRIWEIWDSGEVGPHAAGNPRLIVGGHADASFARAARHGDGWIAGGSGPEEFAKMARQAREAWGQAGRDGEPHLMALAYFSLGENAERDAEGSLGDYYAWLGDEVASMIVAGAATDEHAVRSYLDAYGEAGCDELIFFPSSADAAQVDLLAEAAGLRARATA
jgi:alkanesulfonate monooxygenase SsuD/methylene tetrahydromethanopterin reductase-like flavin-dependent oxidoreductase (luciferase family)